MLFLFDDKNEPADIFSDIPSEKPEARPPMPAGAPATGTTSPLAVGESGVIIESAPFGKKWVLIGLLAVVVLGGAGWFFLSRKPQAASSKPETPAVEQPLPAPEPAPAPEPEPAPEPAPAPAPEPATTTEPAPAPPPSPAAVDTDGDGLADDEEARLGTDPNSVDTDGDGLTDREEVRTWGTEPKNPDTDGDSFSDGREVKGGYNPKGTGKLLQIPQ